MTDAMLDLFPYVGSLEFHAALSDKVDMMIVTRTCTTSVCSERKLVFNQLNVSSCLVYDNVKHTMLTNQIDYSKLPTNPTVDLCFLLDPLVATGGTACAALQMLRDWGLPSK